VKIAVVPSRANWLILACIPVMIFSRLTPLKCTERSVNTLHHFPIGDSSICCVAALAAHHNRAMRAESPNGIQIAARIYRELRIYARFRSQRATVELGSNSEWSGPPTYRCEISSLG
jgi:hypothetical protein